MWNRIWIPMYVLCALFALFIGPAAEASENIYSKGSGPIEIIVFTDYFCPPCRKLEPYLETALTDLHERGAKITFVDKPIHKISPLYSKYFLYAANQATSLSEIMHIRQVLFDIAKTKSVDSEDQLLQQLTQSDIKLQFIQVKPIFDEWVKLIQDFDVRSTPTCVIKLPPREPSVLKGSRRIQEGIGKLLEGMPQLKGGNQKE